MSAVRSRSPAAAAGRPFFALALAATLLFSLVSTATALPTFRRAPAADVAAVELRPESLFRRAAPHVGPTRPVERLRLRRDLDAVPHGRRNAEVAYNVPEVPVTAPVNPKKVRRNVESRLANPKSKRDVVTPLIQAVRPVNPKAKRSTIVAVDSSVLEDPVAVVVSNPKKRSLELQKRAVIEASISVSPTTSSTIKTSTRRSLMNRVRRFLALRDTSSSASGTGAWSGEPGRMILVIPNPKSPNYPGNLPSSSATTTTTRAATATTSKPATTTTSKPATTTTKPATTTTSKPVTTTTTTTSSSAPSSTGWPAEKMLSGAYYPSWVGDVLAPNQINYRLFDVINFAFAIPTADGIVTLDDWSGQILQQVVAGAHAVKTKVAISIGGWTDSTYFSSAVATEAGRTKFVNSILAMVQKYNLDGVDIDWEYPGTNGNPGNQISDSDTTNLLATVQLLRQQLPSTLLSTCTTQTTYVSKGSPLTNVADFANVLDYVMVMNYDVWGASATPGANAPLSDACSGSLQPGANMVSAISTWEGAGMPSNKIIMGVPAYGYVSSSYATSLIHKRDDIPKTGLSNRHLANLAHQERGMSVGHKMYIEGMRQFKIRQEKARLAAKREKRKREAGEKAKRGSPIFCPGNHSGLPCPGITDQNITAIEWNPLANGTHDGTIAGPGGVFQGPGGIKVGTGDVSSLLGNQITFRQMISSGVIAKNPTTLGWDGANGYTAAWDSCSSTPFVYDQSRGVVITYDDPHSLGLKGQMAAQKGIRGMLMWDMSGDTSDFQLVQSYRSAMGLNPLGY